MLSLFTPSCAIWRRNCTQPFRWLDDESVIVETSWLIGSQVWEEGKCSAHNGKTAPANVLPLLLIQKSHNNHCNIRSSQVSEFSRFDPKCWCCCCRFAATALLTIWAAEKCNCKEFSANSHPQTGIYPSSSNSKWNVLKFLLDSKCNVCARFPTTARYTVLTWNCWLFWV